MSVKNGKSLLLVCDTAQLRKKITDSFKDSCDEIIEQENPEAALKVLKKRSFSSIISDIKFFNTGFDFICEVKNICPETGIVFFSAKPGSTDVKYSKVTHISTSEAHPQSEVIEFVLNNQSADIKNSLENLGLSSKQILIMDYISKGECNKIIASHLKISEQGVKYHVSLLLKKFKVSSRKELQNEIKKIVSQY